jgi:nucleoside-diphosphate-sugar epimerase
MTALRVAVTGATGEIGRPFIRQLEAIAEVREIRAMARRSFTPSKHGWTRTTFVRGDVTNPEDVRRLVEGTDVVVHLAFLILGGRRETRVTNLQGSRTVFDAAVAAGSRRIVYTSSVAAYGFGDHRRPLTEDTPARGTAEFYYSAQKAELEQALAGAVRGTGVETYVFRPPLVGGPEAYAPLHILPQVRLAEALPVALPLGPLKLLPDFGVAFQVVHVDDVASALCAGVVGKGSPGLYNLAAPGQATMTDIAQALGWRTVRLPRGAIVAAAGIHRRLPVSPGLSDWVQALKVPVIMATDKARYELGWRPTRDAAATLRETVEGARAAHLSGVA